MDRPPNGRGCGPRIDGSGGQSLLSRASWAMRQKGIENARPFFPMPSRLTTWTPQAFRQTCPPRRPVSEARTSIWKNCAARRRSPLHLVFALLGAIPSMPTFRGFVSLVANAESGNTDRQRALADHRPLRLSTPIYKSADVFAHSETATVREYNVARSGPQHPTKVSSQPSEPRA
jgi:hypothetical protein